MFASYPPGSSAFWNTIPSRDPKKHKNYPLMVVNPYYIMMIDMVING
jgi:hypothetical protein